MTQELAILTQGLTKEFDVPTSPRGARSASPPENRQRAVSDIDLAVTAGEVYGLIGPNGAGKTTLIRLLATAETPTVGEIYLFGQRLKQDEHNLALKRRIGYLPDDYPLYDELTVWDYLDYFARLYGLQQPRRRHRLHEVLELVQLTGKRHSPITTLSRGMRQRLSLARTIIHEPLLLLLDEPVSGLDPIARLHFRDLIRALREAGMTIVISSHVLSDLAELCTTIGVMELGFLVESASLADLYQRWSQQRLIISSLGGLDALQAELRNHPAVVAIDPVSTPPQPSSSLAAGASLATGTPTVATVQVNFTGGPDTAAALLRQLVEAGLPIAEFRPEQEDLEAIFLKLGHQQAN